MQATEGRQGHVASGRSHERVTVQGSGHELSRTAGEIRNQQHTPNRGERSETAHANGASRRARECVRDPGAKPPDQDGCRGVQPAVLAAVELGTLRRGLAAVRIRNAVRVVWIEVTASLE